MAVNDFLPFATGPGANVEDQATWAVDPDRPVGFRTGLAKSFQINKAIRQATFVGSAISEWVNQVLVTIPIPDDSNIQEWVNNFDAALRSRMTGLINTLVPPMIDAEIARLVPGMIANYVNAVVPGMIANYVNANVPGMINNAIAAQVPGMISYYINAIVPNMIVSYINSLVPGMIANAVPRQRVGSITVYVATWGNDGWSGLSPSSPFRTIQHGFNVVLDSYDLSVNGLATVAIETGTYYEAVYIPTPPTGSVAVFNLRVTTYSGPVYMYSNPRCFSLGGGASLGIAGNIVMSSQGDACIQIEESSHCWIGPNGVIFGPSSGNHLLVGTGSTIEVTYGTTYYITGSAGGSHMSAQNNGAILCADCAIQLAANIGFGQSFAAARNNGTIDLYDTGFQIGGFISCYKYLILSNGVINTYGAGAGYLPGDSAGIIASGGQYT